MRLGEVHILTLVESTFIDSVPILEDEAAPKWQFDYNNWRHDPHPSILLLGNYRHPNTGNNLVGGINLNYLNNSQINKLQKSLPKIMRAGNLYSRYHLGRRLLPDVFDSYYRTYNADHIQGVEPSTLYPKYGYLKTAQNWLKKKLNKLWKSPEDQDKEAEPQYPDDLSYLQNRFNQVKDQYKPIRPTAGLAGEPVSDPEEIDTPQMQTARDAFLKYQKERQLANQEDDIFSQAFNAPVDHEMPISNVGQSIENQKVQNTQKLSQPPIDNDPLDPTPETPQKPPHPSHSLPSQPDLPQSDLSRQELPADEEISENYIRYFSPLAGGYVITPAFELFIENRGSNLYSELLMLRRNIVDAAQNIYDDWDQSDSNNGICDEISAAVSEILSLNGIDTTDGGHDGDDHAYTIAYDDFTAYIVDIPYNVYERGGGYSWVKIPNVVFSIDDVVIVEIDRPDWIE